MLEDWSAVFKCRVTVRVHLIKYHYFYYIQRTADLFVTKFNRMVHRHKLDCLLKRFDCSVVVKVKVREKVQNSSECSPGRLSLIHI